MRPGASSHASPPDAEEAAQWASLRGGSVAGASAADVDGVGVTGGGSPASAGAASLVGGSVAAAPATQTTQSTSTDLGGVPCE